MSACSGCNWMYRSLFSLRFPSMGVTTKSAGFLLFLSKIKYFIVINSRTCVEEAIGVVGVQKKILCGKACKNLVGSGSARESPRVRTLLMRYMA